MVIVGLIQDMGGEQMIGLGSYHFNQATTKAEVSFLVRDGWQAKGIGTDLLDILTDIAKKRGILGFEAEVLEQNQLMLAVFYNSGYQVSTKKMEDMYHISYMFKS
jgi:GNAT superfamily N-acetyltransferase